MAINRRVTLGWGILASVTLVLVIFILVQAALLFRSHQVSVRAAEQWAQQQTQVIATDLSQRMRAIAKIADELAADLSSAACSPCNTEPRLTNFYLRHSEPAALGWRLTRASRAPAWCCTRLLSAAARPERLLSGLMATTITKPPARWRAGIYPITPRLGLTRRNN